MGAATDAAVGGVPPAPGGGGAVLLPDWPVIDPVPKASWPLEPDPPAPATNPPPAPASPADDRPADADAGSSGGGVELDIDFGGGASVGGLHLHLSGLDQSSAEHFIDHFAKQADEPADDSDVGDGATDTTASPAEAFGTGMVHNAAAVDLPGDALHHLGKIDITGGDDHVGSVTDAADGYPKAALEPAGKHVDIGADVAKHPNGSEEQETSYPTEHHEPAGQGIRAPDHGEDIPDGIFH